MLKCSSQSSILIRLTMDWTKKFVLSQFCMQSHLIFVVLDFNDINSTVKKGKFCFIMILLRLLNCFTFHFPQTSHSFWPTNWISFSSLVYVSIKVGNAATLFQRDFEAALTATEIQTVNRTGEKPFWFILQAAVTLRWFQSVERRVNLFCFSI
jgi:hypothetical protein